ncbi:trophoblast glycoprotein-like [Anneissia japonica]|uniref:trophoblast glycoprotein-like n=1 Tax=Anneissia japonica TaxID=1529436 RepID=UPI0014257F34|nr:trophoblast glycoprotein-like [Anneissia japonica]XP_033107018.1 trophoblast glycoprotein-like [Anneissia japonica]
MMRLLLLLTIPCSLALNCKSSHHDSWCKCTDLDGDLLKIVCTGEYGLPKLIPDNTAELHITDSNITYLTANFLKKEMPQLKVLNLTGNELMYIDPSAFNHNDFKVLEQLILDNNKLVLSGRKLISSLNRLKILSMKNAFFNGTYASLIGTALMHSHTLLLESIILDDNDLSGGLDVTTFNFSLYGKESKSHITTISLRNTSLILFFGGTLNKTHLPNLVFVDLSKNKLQTIRQDIIDDLENFINLTVDFTGNPFVCNCELYDFVTWLNESNSVSIVNKEEYVCSNDSLKKIRGRNLVDLNPKEDLKDKCIDIVVNKDSTSYIALSVMLGVVGLLAVIILYLRRGECFRFFQGMFDVAHSDKGGYTDMDNSYLPETPTVDV